MKSEQIRWSIKYIKLKLKLIMLTRTLTKPKKDCLQAWEDKILTSAVRGRLSSLLFSWAPVKEARVILNEI